MTNPYAPPGETASDLWLEKSNLIGAVLGGVAYGTSSHSVYVGVIAFAANFSLLRCAHCSFLFMLLRDHILRETLQGATSARRLASGFCLNALCYGHA